jgi:hypothetical protein
MRTIASLQSGCMEKICIRTKRRVQRLRPFYCRNRKHGGQSNCDDIVPAQVKADPVSLSFTDESCDINTTERTQTVLFDDSFPAHQLT